MGVDIVRPSITIAAFRPTFLLVNSANACAEAGDIRNATSGSLMRGSNAGSACVISIAIDWAYAAVIAENASAKVRPPRQQKRAVRRKRYLLRGVLGARLRRVVLPLDNARGFSAPAAQIVKLGATHLAAA